MASIPQKQFVEAVEKLRTQDEVMFGRQWYMTRTCTGAYILTHYNTFVCGIMTDGRVTLGDKAYSNSDRDGINSLSMLVLGRQVCKIKNGEIVEVE